MSEKAELRARVTLNSTAFQSGLKSISRDLGMFKKSVVDPFATFGSNLGRAALVGGAMASAGLGLAFRAAYKLTSEIEGLQEQTGIATDLLSELAYAGKGAGVGADAIAKAYAAFAKSKAGKGGGSFLGELKRVDDISDPIKRAQAAMATFGKSGMSMLSLLDGGWEALKGRMREARVLGVSVSPQQTASVERMTFAWERMKAAMSGLSVRLFSFDSITAAMNRVTNAMVRMGRSDLFRRFADGMSGMVDEGVQWLDRLGQAWQMLATNQREQLTGMLGGSAAFIVAWKAGLVEPMLMGLYGIASAFWKLPKAAFGALTGIVGGIAGYSVGKALEQTFGISDFVLAWWSGIRTVWEMWTASLEKLPRLARYTWQMVRDTFKTGGSEAVDEEFTFRIATLGKQLADQWKASIANQREYRAVLEDIREEEQALRNEDKRPFSTKVEDALSALPGEFFNAITPQALRDYLAAIGSIKTPDLPNVPETMGLGQAAIASADIASNIERASRAGRSPLRGAIGQFLTGGRNRYGSRGDSVLPFADRMVSAAVLSGRQPAITVGPVVAEQRRTNTILAVMSTNLANSTMGLQGLAWGG